MTCAASTNSRPRSASTWPRSGLAAYGMNTRPITAIGIAREPASISMGPMLAPRSVKAVPSITPSRSAGNDQIRSRMRLITASVRPRK